MQQDYLNAVWKDLPTIKLSKNISYVKMMEHGIQKKDLNFWKSQSRCIKI